MVHKRKYRVLQSRLVCVAALDHSTSDPVMHAALRRSVPYRFSGFVGRPPIDLNEFAVGHWREDLASEDPDPLFSVR